MSKSYHMPGWRIAYMVGCPRLIDALAHIKTYTDYGTFAPVQHAAAWALDHGEQIVDEVRALYQARAEVLVDGLREAGWDNVAAPASTMFVWAPLPSIYRGLSALEATSRLIREAHVAVSPGSGFGEGGEGYVRFALIEDPPRIKEACQRIARLLQRAA
jgi:alanine-synthesizing transaminase